MSLLTNTHSPPGSAPESRAATEDHDWDHHWNTYANTASVNPAQAYRRKLVLESLGLEEAPRPVRLLELGSGQGDFGREVSSVRTDLEFIGVDLSESGVRIAQEKAPGARFFCRNLCTPLDLPDELRGFASHAVCAEVLEHVDDPAAVLRNARPYFAPGCKLVVTVPGGPMSAFDRHIGHRGHFSTERLAGVIRGAGLEVESVHGAGFPFFNLYRLAVIARGSALIEDAAADSEADLPLVAQITMKAFGALFRLNRGDTRLGWQVVACAREPLGPSRTGSHR